MRPRSDRRNEFLTDILTGAIENGGHGWFSVDEYKWESVPLGGAYALVTDEEEDEQHRIDLDVIAKGLGVIRDAELREVSDYDGSHKVPHNKSTGERMYLGQDRRAEIMLADRTNGEDGDLDVIDYLAVVECGLFGKVVYA